MNHQATLIAAGTALFLLPAAGVAAEEITSGVAVGEIVSAFEVTKCGGAEGDGVKVGAQLCYVCSYDVRPVVLVFARKPDAQVRRLAAELDRAVARQRKSQLAAFISLLGPDRKPLLAQARELAADAALKRVPVVVPLEQFDAGPEEFHIHRDAQVSVMLYREGRRQSQPRVRGWQAGPRGRPTDRGRRCEDLQRLTVDRAKSTQTGGEHASPVHQPVGGAGKLFGRHRRWRPNVRNAPARTAGAGRANNPLMRALDADGDGTLSKQEIEIAVEALKKLDANGDGNLTRNELQPQRSGGRQGLAAPGGNFAETIIERLQAADKDGDGRSPRQKRRSKCSGFSTASMGNQDGAIDEAELKALRERFSRQQRPGAGNRPQRPRDGRREV